MLSYEDEKINFLEIEMDALVAGLHTQKAKILETAKIWNKNKKAREELAIIELFEIYEKNFVEVKGYIDKCEDYFEDPENIERFKIVKENWNKAVKLYEEVYKLANEKLGGYGKPKQNYKEF